MFIYNSATGRFVHDDEFWAKGYSGHPPHRNDPSAEGLHAEGPIPRGMWKIEHSRDGGPLGPVVFNLDPVGHDAHGRSLFRIHGDSARHPGEASDGCIILDHETRAKIAALVDGGKDDQLHVV